MVKNLQLFHKQIRALLENAVDDIDEYLVKREKGADMAKALTKLFMEGVLAVSFDPETNQASVSTGPLFKKKKDTLG